MATMIATTSGAAAYDLVCSMEDEVTMLRDLAELLNMVAAGNGSITQTSVGAVLRLSWLMAEACENLEKKRCDAFDLLRPHKHPSARVAATGSTGEAS